MFYIHLYKYVCVRSVIMTLLPLEAAVIDLAAAATHCSHLIANHESALKHLAFAGKM